MLKRTLTMFATLSVIVLLAATSAHAEPDRLKFSVPFDFSVGSDVLPAGDYTLERVFAHDSKLFRIHSADNRHQATFLITTSVHTNHVNKARVVFKRHDQRYALTRFWLAGAGGARVLPLDY